MTRPERSRFMFVRTALAPTLLAATLTMGSVAHADIVHLNCTQTGADEYRLTYDFTGTTRSVAITAGTDPNNVAASTPVSKTAAKSITLHAGKPGERVYFYLKADTGEVREVSIRHLPLQGTPNFRDLGGYQTTDGHYVRWGMIYRSGVLTYLTPADYSYLTNLGIRVVCDFRSKQENESEPERWIPGASTNMISLPMGGPKKDGKEASVQNILGNDPTPEKLRARMINSYGDFAFAASDQYAAVFQQVKNESLPLLYHCSAGKDRTGVFSALLLLTLGVPEKTVLEDYALTNKYLLENLNDQTMQKLSNSPWNSLLAHLTKEQRAILMAADPAYLESTLRHIDMKYGSFDNYRRQQLHLSDADVQQLRAKLTVQ